MQPDKAQTLYDQLIQAPEMGTVQNIYSDLTEANVEMHPPIVRIYNDAINNPNDAAKRASAIAAFKVLLRQLGAQDPNGGRRGRRTKKRKALKKRTTRRR